MIKHADKGIIKLHIKRALVNMTAFFSQIHKQQEKRSNGKLSQSTLEVYSNNIKFLNGIKVPGTEI
ncbi:hypothetical protein ES044_16400 [Polaribacter sp. IC066]|uniref:hypothetical protein n=1 Tax=Polaribacter sp. IC066 TaxID=57032 RepID=UPI0011BF6DF1|nr:hypothetical protein [Polaribacter sp. IC066]TXD56685.1 hypothetical protein ES044_16400 [Polaribacter sp. IC066]